MDELKALLRDGRQLKVAVDMDETLAKIHPLMIANFNKVNGTNFTVKDHIDFGFKNLGSCHEEMMPFYVQVWKEQWREIPLNVDVKLLGELAKYYEVNILTARSPNAKGETGGTVDALNEFLKLHKINLVLPPPVLCDPKYDKARDFDYDIYVDDSPRLAETIAKMDGKTLLLIDHLYNRYVKEDGKKIIRVESAQKAIATLILLARKEHRLVKAG